MDMKIENYKYHILTELNHRDRERASNTVPCGTLGSHLQEQNSVALAFFLLSYHNIFQP